MKKHCIIFFLLLTIIEGQMYAGCYNKPAVNGLPNSIDPGNNDIPDAAELNCTGSPATVTYQHITGNTTSATTSATINGTAVMRALTMYSYKGR